MPLSIIYALPNGRSLVVSGITRALHCRICQRDVIRQVDESPGLLRAYSMKRGPSHSFPEMVALTRYPVSTKQTSVDASLPAR